MEDDGSSLDKHLGAWIESARTFAHDPAHHIDVTAGEHPGHLYPEELRLKIRLPGWQSALTFHYSVDKVPTGEGEVRLMRHLSCQYSLPGEIRQGDVEEAKQGLLQAFLPIVRTLWPLAQEITQQFDLHEPIPVQNPATRQVSFRTPLVWHFAVPHDGGPMLGHTAAKVLDAKGRPRATETNLAPQARRPSKVDPACLPESLGGMVPDEDFHRAAAVVPKE